MNEIKEIEGLDDVSLNPSDYQLMKKINEIVSVVNKLQKEILIWTTTRGK